MTIYSLIKSVLLSVPVTVTIIDYCGYVARVDGVSMQPALNPDRNRPDYVFLNKLAIRNSYTNIQRGDIISFKSPKDPQTKLIKRVVAIPGDIVATLSHKNSIVQIPEGHCWVEGDHKGRSLDSNNFGPVSLGLVTAKASCIVWPPSRWQFFKPELPEARAPLNLAERVFF